MPAIVAVSLFHFFFAWNDFLAPLVYLVGHEELWPISVGMSYFAGQYTQLPHLIQATALMALALPVGIFVLAQRVFVQGVVVNVLNPKRVLLGASRCTAPAISTGPCSSARRTLSRSRQLPMPCGCPFTYVRSSPFGSSSARSPRASR